MGIIDMLAEKARQEQAAAAPAPVQPAPALIPPGTPTPAVSLAEIEADRQARKAAAEFARVDPEAAMAGAVAIPAPPEPKLIPIGTPTPAVSPEEIAADREARRLAMEAAQSTQPATAPSVQAPAALAQAPIEPVPPIAQEVPAELTAPAAPALPEQEEAAFAAGQPLVPEQSTIGLPSTPAEPTFGEKLGSIAKKRGKGFLDALQAGLYNFAGITKPTDYEKQVETEAAEKKDLLDKQWQQQLMKIQSDFQAAQSQMDREFSISVAQAKNAWDVQAAKDAHAQQSQENALDRQNNLDVATQEYQQQKTMTLDQIRQLIQSTYGGQ